MVGRGEIEVAPFQRLLKWSEEDVAECEGRIGGWRIAVAVGGELATVDAGPSPCSRLLAPS